MSAAVCLLLACGAAAAGEYCGTPNCCSRCGCGGPCQKVCQVVCEMQPVTTVCWVVVCEDFCVPWPTCHRGQQPCQQEGCQAAGCGGSTCRGPCATPPRCGNVRTRKKLVKREITRQIPVYKCVVKYMCGDCTAQQRQAAGAAAAPPPAAEPLSPYGPAPLPPPSPLPTRPPLPPYQPVPPPLSPSPPTALER